MAAPPERPISSGPAHPDVMKQVLIPASLVLFAGGPVRDVAIVYEPEEGTVLTRTFEAIGEMSLTAVEVTVDGEELEREWDEFDYEYESLERIVVTDELAEVQGGRPTDLVRTFDELLQEASSTIAGEELETISLSELEGRTVRFLWDDEDEVYVVETSDDEDDIDEDVLAWLAEDMDLRLLLPDGEVEEGDEWEIDAAAYLTLMWPSGLLGFVDEGKAKDPVQRELNEEVIENLEGEGSATFEELREEDGVRLALISVELEIETWADSAMEQEGVEIEIEVEISRDITGEILWDLDHGHLFAADLEADAEYVRTMTRPWETPNGEVELTEVRTFSGTIGYTVEIERED